MQLDVVRDMQKAMGGKKLLAFVSDDFDTCAQTAYQECHILELSFANVWYIFQDLLTVRLLEHHWGG